MLKSDGLQKFVNYVNNLPKNLFWRRMFLWFENILEPKLEPYYRNCFAVEYNRISLSENIFFVYTAIQNRTYTLKQSVY